MAELNEKFDAAVSEALEKLAAEPEVDTEGEPSGNPDLLSEVETDSEVEGDQAAEEDQEQSESLLEPLEEEVSEDDASLFGDLELPDDEPEETQDSFVLPGVDEPVSLQELKDGYLRQRDYTQKTQEVSSQRKEAEKALQIKAALEERPHDFARQLAEAAGLIEPGATPTKVVDLPFRSDEQYQADVTQGIEEALSAHPDILEAQQLVTARWIESEFDRIEETHKDSLAGKTLSAKDREAVLKTAYKNQTDNLELVFEALWSKRQDQARKRESLKASAPAKPTGKASTQTIEAIPKSVDEAALMAAEKLGIKLNL